MIMERQTKVTWHTPDEKLPAAGETVVATISGQMGSYTYDHAFALVWWTSSGWELCDTYLREFTVHAWCDLEPYGG